MTAKELELLVSAWLMIIGLGVAAVGEQTRSLTPKAVGVYLILLGVISIIILAIPELRPDPHY